MFLALIVCQFALAVANPFHKYPYVFLLDVGNEELQNTNTEQLRVSVPGGSLALRYPAVGEGETISHVRVNGIDFGTDLKANILDGGPGYKYVVLVFMGNTGTSYDAVITIQTVCDDDINNNDGTNEADQINDTLDDANDSSEVTDSEIDEDNIEKSDDLNDSSEDTSDVLENQSVGHKNAEVQESSNNYSYVHSDRDDDENNEDADGSEIQTNSDNNINVSSNDYSHDSTSNEQNEEDSGETADKSLIDVQSDDGTGWSGGENQNSQEQYAIPKTNLYNGVKVYPQFRVPFVLTQNSAYNPEDSVEFDQMFNDEDNHGKSEKLRDSISNKIDYDSNSVAI